MTRNKNILNKSTLTYLVLNPFRTPFSFWGQTILIPSSLPPIFSKKEAAVLKGLIPTRYLVTGSIFSACVIFRGIYGAIQPAVVVVVLIVVVPPPPIFEHRRGHQVLDSSPLTMVDEPNWLWVWRRDHRVVGSMEKHDTEYV